MLGGREGERRRERVSEPANIHTMSSEMAVFIHSRHDAVGAIFVLLEKLFSTSIKGSGDEGRQHESLCTNAFDSSHARVLEAALNYGPTRAQSSRSENVKHHTQSPHTYWQYTVAQ